MATSTRLIEKDVLRAHTRVSSWRSPSVMVIVYALIVLTAWLATAVFGWWFTPIAILAIGCLQHYLFVLHHDAAHFGFHPNRTVNWVVADALLGIPLGTRLKYYHALHMDHHRHVRDDKDPEMSLLSAMLCSSLPMAVVEAITGITAFRSSLWYFKYIREAVATGAVKGSPVGDILAFAAVWGPPIAISYYFGWLWGFGLYWVVPLLCVYIPLIKMHSYADHMLVPAADAPEYDRTLTRRFGPLSTFIFNPLNAGEHLAHHLFSSVPWYHLPSFAKHLEQNETYREESKKWYCDGYFVGKSTVLERVVIPSTLS